MNLKESLDLFENYLFKEVDENPKVEKAKKEIKMLMVITPFPIITLAFLSSYFTLLEKNKELGTGLVMFIFIFIYVIWVFAILHKDKMKKNHHTVYQAKNY